MATAPVRAVSSTLRQVGARIRLARKRHRMTLAHVAEATGLTPSMLSMVERGVAAPSIGALVAISDVLKIPMASLFQPAHDGDDARAPVRRREAQSVISTGRGAQRRLVIRDAADNIELAENTYLPGASSAEQPLRHLGREFGIVLSGRLQVEAGGEVYVLRRGDAILVDSSMPHRFTNIGRGVVRTLWVNVHGNRWSEE